MDGLRSEKNSARGLKKVPRLSPRPLRAHDEFVQILSVLGVYGEAGADVCVDKGIVEDRQSRQVPVPRSVLEHRRRRLSTDLTSKQAADLIVERLLTALP